MGLSKLETAEFDRGSMGEAAMGFPIGEGLFGYSIDLKVYWRPWHPLNRAGVTINNKPVFGRFVQQNDFARARH